MTAAVLVVVVAVLAVVGERQIHSARDQVAQLRTDQAGARVSAAVGAAALTAARAQIGGLQSQLTATQNRLKSDESKLDVTTASLPPNVVKLAAQVSPSVVYLACGTEAGTGFGFDLPTADGYRSVVVTAAHVVAACGPAARPVAPLTLSLDGRALPAVVRSLDSSQDVALVDVAGVVPALEPAVSLQTGQFTAAIGNALGEVIDNVTDGNVSSVGAGYFVFSAPISSGNSGGPLVDATGHVLGIADATKPPVDALGNLSQNLNIALRLNTLCESLLSGGLCTSLH